MDNQSIKRLAKVGNVIMKDAVIFEKKAGLPKKFKVPEVKLSNKTFLGGGKKWHLK